MTSFPYVPTWVLSYNDLVYILSPSAPNSGTFQLVALNATHGFNTTQLSTSAQSNNLPFANDGQNVVITPVIDERGNILVYTGACRNGSTGSAVWQFTPIPKSLNGNGTWEQLQSAGTNGQDDNILDGANYLSAAAAFSESANSTASIYIFGGMCPNSTNITEDSWVSDAEYSNEMLVLAPSEASNARTYNLSMSAGRGPPIAEAGLTMTPLLPTFSNSSNNESQSQNQNFVLIGGQTQQAFINMSQIALFSLPEQSWSFIPIDSPKSPSTDLAVRDTATVDPRSGHTAVLTADGKRIVVIGGWVGDVKNPANPQVAILELGSGFGGTGDWQWSIPDPSGNGIASGTGLYGHGATMLAGDVLLVTGGYQIQASGGSKHRRTAAPPNTNNFLLNVTSNTWISSYTHPKAAHTEAGAGKLDGNGQDEATKAGLGVGLTFGILAIFAAIAVYLWYGRRLKHLREAREDELRNLAAGAHRLQLTNSENAQHGTRSEMSTVDPGVRDRLWTSNAYPWNSAHPTSTQTQRPMPEAERTGLLFEIPSPTRGLRKSLHSRAMYHPAPRYDDGRRTHSNAIHPIDERDEYDDGPSMEDPGAQNDVIHQRDYNLLSNVPVLDPFRDPPDRSRTPSPQSPQAREAEVRGWVDDWTAADAILHHGGRWSPEKTDRTSSSLSDQSARSLMSHASMQQSVASVSRTLSQRSAALFSATPTRPQNESAVQDTRTAPVSNASPSHGHRRTRSLGLPPSTEQHVPHESTPEDRNSFPQLQYESEALLGEYPGQGETSPTKLHRRARGWMGSVRRALTGADRSASTSPENNASTSSSPTKQRYTDEALPRRAASTGGMYWQKKKGAKDWGTDGPSGTAEHRAGRDEDDDGDWDVESAVERRVVQVMFTVPKEKLRVVNQGPDEDGESTVSAPREDTVEEHTGPSTSEKGKARE